MRKETSKEAQGRAWRAFHAPSEDFVQKTRIAFLSAFDKSLESRARGRRPASYFLRGLATGVASVLVLISGAVYAEQRDVSADSFLYPLKRSYEAVSFSVVSRDDRPALHLEYAERRLLELEDLKSRDATNKQIIPLTADFKKELELSMAVFDDEEEEHDTDTADDATENSILDAAPDESDAKSIRLRESDSQPKIQSASGKRAAPSLRSRKRRKACRIVETLWASKATEVRDVINGSRAYARNLEKKCPDTDIKTADD